MAADRPRARREDAGPDAGENSPLLDEGQQQQAAESAALRPLVIHEILRDEGEVELKRPAGALFWSGVAAGLSMGFSLLGLALLSAGLSDAPWAHVIASAGYSVGFVIAVLGRQQLFTETTLTATLPLFMRRDLPTLAALMRMWAIVLAANLIGTVVFAWLISRPGLFPEPVTAALTRASMEVVEGAFVPTVIKAVLAGWLIALMVWLLPAAESARLLVIMLLTYVVALGHFPHVIAGSADAAYAVFSGHAGIRQYFLGFLAPTLLGNSVGGVALAALLNHAPVAHELAAAEEEAEEEGAPAARGSKP